MAKKRDIDSDENRSSVLIEAAKSTIAHTYYTAKYTQRRLKDGSYNERIDVYEKYNCPNSELIALLKKEGVEVVFHPRGKGSPKRTIC
jgi:hypothetical protein